MSYTQRRSRDSSRSRGNRESTVDSPNCSPVVTNAHHQQSIGCGAATSGLNHSNSITASVSIPTNFHSLPPQQQQQQQHAWARHSPYIFNPFNNMSGTNPALLHGSSGSFSHQQQSTSGLQQNFLSSGSSSPMAGNRIVKTWRQMGDKTKSKTRDILKRWQSMNNGQASEDSMAGDFMNLV